MKRRQGRFPQFRDLNPVPIGAISLLLLVVLVVGALNIGKLPFTSGKTYSAGFTEAAGLRPGDSVRVGGVVVGKVKSVSLEDSHVKVKFSITNGDVHIGNETSASIEIATLLGNKYVSIKPSGTGDWPTNVELPVGHTTSPYDIEPALQGLGSTIGKINTKQLAGALDTLATTFKDSPASLRSTLTGLSRLSTTIASRDDELSTLLQHTSKVTRVLADRRSQFTQVLGDGTKLLTELDQRRQVINQLLVNTSTLAAQLTGLVHDNEVAIKPMLSHLHNVLNTLNSNQDNLSQIIKELYVFVRGEVDATGAGPWFDGTAVNVTNPVGPGDIVSGILNGGLGVGPLGLGQLGSTPGSLNQLMEPSP